MNKKLIGVLLVLILLMLLFLGFKVVNKNMTVKNLEEIGYTSLYDSKTTFTKDVTLSDARVVKFYYKAEVFGDDMIYTENPDIDYKASSNVLNSKATGCQYGVDESGEFILLETSPISCASAEIDTILFNEIIKESEAIN